MNWNNLFDDVNLPKPLTKDELYCCLQQYREGDLKARKKIIAHNICLVIYQVSNRFANTPFEKDELISLGLVGLIRATDTFDIEKKYEFSTYAIRCIDNEILMFIRKEKKYLSTQSIYTKICIDDEGNEKVIGDILEDIKFDLISDYEDKITRNEIRKTVYDLPDREKEIIMLYFGFINDKIYNQYEIAEKFNISQSYISRFIKKILKKIKLQLEEKEIIERVGRTAENDKTVKQSLNNNELKKNEGINIATKLQALYEYFNSYSQEQINEVINKLTDKERNFLILEYGHDLEKTITSESYEKEETDKSYGNLIPKIKRLLANSDGKYNKK